MHVIARQKVTRNAERSERASAYFAAFGMVLAGIEEYLSELFAPLRDKCLLKA